MSAHLELSFQLIASNTVHVRRSWKHSEFNPSCPKMSCYHVAKSYLFTQTNPTIVHYSNQGYLINKFSHNTHTHLISGCPTAIQHMPVYSM